MLPSSKVSTRQLLVWAGALGVAVLVVLVGQTSIRVSSQFAAAAAAPEIPQSVYDQWADPSVSVINMPQGTYKLKGSGVVNGAYTLNMNRSNVTVNFRGFTLLVDPADGANSGFYPVQVASTPVSGPAFPPISPGREVPTRTISHLMGGIHANTTQLTMDPNEVVDVQPGETVLLWAGVTPTDPVEVEAFIPATVASVNATTHVITFTAPLGKDITNYGSLDALKAVTESSLQYKIGEWGTWPDGGNYSKGYGVDHGMERFVGGMVHDVTFNDLTMVLDPVTDASKMPNGMWDISAVAVKDLTMNNTTIENPHSNTIHLWRTFNTLIDGATFTGAGSQKIWNTAIDEAFALTIWGGDNLKFRNIKVQGTDISLFNTEVNPSNISLDGLQYNVTYTALRNYGSPTIFGLWSARNAPVIKNVSIQAASTGGTHPLYFPYTPLVLEGNVEFVGGSLVDWFDWGYQRKATLDGTVTIGGVTYGPAVTQTVQFPVVHGAGARDFTPPKGLYTHIRFRLLNNGDIRDITDSKDHFFAAASSGAWTELSSTAWYLIAPGDTALNEYLNKYVRFWLNNSGSVADGLAEFEYTYLPEGGTPPPPPPPPPTCTESWSCTAWSACSRATQSRTCTDANSCGTTTSKPALTQSCTVSDTTAPTTSLSNPATGSTLSGTAQVTAAANDDTGVAQVEVYADSARIASLTVAPYTFMWDTTTVSNGPHALFAKAYDAAGNVGSSGQVNVAVKNQAPVTFSVGDRVKVTRTVSLRNSLSSAKTAGSQREGSLGTLTSGPTQRGVDIWWKVNFDRGKDGYVQSQDLAKVTVSAASTHFDLLELVGAAAQAIASPIQAFIQWLR